MWAGADLGYMYKLGAFRWDHWESEAEKPKQCQRRSAGCMVAPVLDLTKEQKHWFSLGCLGTTLCSLWDRAHARICRSRFFCGAPTGITRRRLPLGKAVSLSWVWRTTGKHGVCSFCHKGKDFIVFVFCKVLSWILSASARLAFFTPKVKQVKHGCHVNKLNNFFLKKGNLRLSDILNTIVKVGTTVLYTQ